jgi:PTH1 family peptidyl-tRNA hydrolase
VIVGLRNPGERYERTRPNLGAGGVAALAARHGATFKSAPRFMRAEVAEVRIGDHAVVLTLPRTFMNESGQAVAPLVKYFHVDTDRLLVVHDDIDLPLGRLRVQGGRGHGGNNGVRSVVGSLGTRDFWRLRCGVGRPPGSQDPADYVLRPFAVKEREEAALVVEHACDLAELFVAEGGEAARQRAGELGPDRP